jgi:transglutaminase-like putative cysteine protease
MTVAGFMKHFFTRALLALFGFSIAYPALAVASKNDGIDPSASIDKNLQHFVVNPDGTFELTVNKDIKINEARAVGRLAQYPLSYNQTLEQLTIVSAYTLKPDGRRVAVQPGGIKDQQEANSANAPMFQDSRVKVVIFPEVAAGDHLLLEYKVKRLQPMFPGQFEDLTIPAFFPTKTLELSYDMPAGVALHADNKGFKAEESPLENGRKRYRWIYQPSDKARLENDSVAYTDYGDHLAVSTFADYRSFATAYNARAEDKQAVTPKIRALAEQLAGRIPNPRDKAEVLSDWVRRNIRYVAVYIGPGGVVPHAAEQVLDNRYGDCKDHVALLGALLKAVGIDSTPALLNARNAYQLPSVPTLGVMNHAINYVPSLDLYLDSTAESIAAGFLPVSDVDKPALLTEQGKIGHTPRTQTSILNARAEFKLDRNGAAEISYRSTLSGWLAEMNRHVARNSTPNELDRSVEGMLSMYGMKGEGQFDAGHVNQDSTDYTVGVAGRVENMAYLPGPFGIPTITNLMGGLRRIVSTLTSEKERSQSFVCQGADIREEGRFDLPKQIDVIALPKPVTLSNPYLDYHSTFERVGEAVVVKRHFQFHHASSVCSPEDFRAMRDSLDQVTRDLRSQIIVKS